MVHLLFLNWGKTLVSLLPTTVCATDTLIVAGSMCFMSGSIELENVFLPENEVGVWHWLFGKSVTSIVLRNSGASDGYVGIAAPSLARILPVCAVFCCPLLLFIYLFFEKV